MVSRQQSDYLKSASAEDQTLHLTGEGSLVKVIKAECALANNNLFEAKKLAVDLLKLADQTESVNFKRDVFRITSEIHLV